MTERLEILVHISAPGGFPDDQTYRKQARGFLDAFAIQKNFCFAKALAEKMPSNVTASGSSTSESSIAAPWKPNMNIEAKRSNQNTKASAALTSSFFKPSKEPAIASSDQTRLSPTIQVKRTPFLKRSTTEPSKATQNKALPHRRSQSDSGETMPSVIPDSQPSDSSLKRKICNSCSSQTSSNRPSSPSAKRLRDRPNSSLTLDGAGEDSSEIYITNTGLEVPESSLREFGSGRDAEGSSFDQPPELNGPKVHQPLDDKEPIIDRLVENGRPDFDQLSESECPLSLSASTPRIPKIKRSRRILRPQPPRTSNQAFKTHLTPSLERLRSERAVLEAFRPLKFSRALRTLERGHWLFKVPPSWPKERRKQFLDYTERFVVDGRAGWGVWMETGQEGGEDDECNHEHEEEDWEDVVRLWCWGEVAREIWLMLFVGSKRLIKGIGALWIDAGQEVIIQME